MGGDPGLRPSPSRIAGVAARRDDGYLCQPALAPPV